MSITSTTASSPYSTFTSWADQGLIGDKVLSEKYALAPLRKAIFKNETLIKDLGALNKTKKIVLTVLFTLAFVISPFVNCVQHAVSSARLVFNAPFNRSAYPELKNDHPLAIIMSGLISFPLAPIFAILSTLGSVFKTIDQIPVSK